MFDTDYAIPRFADYCQGIGGVNGEPSLTSISGGQTQASRLSSLVLRARWIRKALFRLVYLVASRPVQGESIYEKLCTESCAQLLTVSTRPPNDEAAPQVICPLTSSERR